MLRLHSTESRFRDVGLCVANDYDHEQMDRLYNSYTDPDNPEFDEALREEMHNYRDLADKNVPQLNKDQRDIFDKVKEALRTGVQELMFVSGDGGTGKFYPLLGLNLISITLGKTFLYNTLIAWLKAEGKKVISCASTGVASILLYEGMTAHSAFKVPLDVDPHSRADIPAESDLGKLIRETEVIIIDEISMLHRDTFAFIDKQVRALSPRSKRHLAFGGKTVLCSGDFKQLAPVVVPGGRYE